MTSHGFEGLTNRNYKKKKQEGYGRNVFQNSNSLCLYLHPFEELTSIYKEYMHRAHETQRISLTRTKNMFFMYTFYVFRSYKAFTSVQFYPKSLICLTFLVNTNPFVLLFFLSLQLTFTTLLCSLK